MLCLYKTMLAQLSFLTTEAALLQTTMSEFAHPLSVHAALNPPSRLRTQLLANPLEAKKTAASATSAGWATRLSGVSFKYACCSSGFRSKREASLTMLVLIIQLVFFSQVGIWRHQDQDGRWEGHLDRTGEEVLTIPHGALDPAR